MPRAKPTGLRGWEVFKQSNPSPSEAGQAIELIL